MRARRLVRVLAPAVVFTFFTVPSMVLAQDAEIAGIVTDNTGGILPGVTVEASSPALIEQSRVVFTDSQGAFRIIALNAGEYTVSFTLPGFSTVVVEGVGLTGTFTANVDAQMSVGGVEETVTVTGESPLIDVQTVTQTEALNSEVLAQLPTGRSFQNVGVLVPGVQVPLSQQDVGGAGGANWQTMEVHGSRGDQMPLMMNGMPFNNMNNTGGGYNHTMAINIGAVAEMTVTTSGTDSEFRSSGVVANSIAKEGGNEYTFDLYTDFTNGGLQSDNLSQALIDQGLRSVNSVKQVSEFNPSMGGPLVDDRLWFYLGYRNLVSTQWNTESFERIDPLDPQFCRTAGGCQYGDRLVPDQRDFSTPAFAGDQYFHTATLNLTSQITPRNKLTAYYQFSKRHKVSNSGLNRTPEATDYLTSDPNYLGQLKWTSPVTSRLLLEGGLTFFNETWRFLQQPDFPVSSDVIAKRELSTNTRYAADETTWDAYNHQWNMRFSLNYVTGTHSFKVGMQDMWGTRNYTAFGTQAQHWDFNLGAPTRIWQYARPLEDFQKLRAALGFYAQDRWTLDRFTLNLGVRYDSHNAYVPGQTTAELLWVPATTYAEVPNTPAWKDISPRAGLSWDLFGTGQTVLRANFGRYVASESVATATANNPVNTRVNAAFRTWADANGDFVPNCDLRNRGANGECGAMSAQLGDPAIVTRWNPEIVRGFGVRPDDTEILFGLQQGLTPRISLDVQWTRHWYGNFFATQNRATPASGFDQFCVAAPADSRLPNGGGNEICGFANIQPAFFGGVDNWVTSAAEFGDVTDVYTGMDVSVQGRLENGGIFNVGVSTGRERTDYCDIIQHASLGSNAATSAGTIGSTNIASFPSTNYCSKSPPYQPDFKALATYPLPYDLTVSAVWQNRAGPEVLASYFVTDAGITGLNRSLTGGGQSVHLVAPGTQYGERVNQLDLRFSRSLNIGEGRVQVNAALYNVFNSDATLTWNTAFGPSWLAPTQIMQGRMFKIGATVSY